MPLLLVVDNLIYRYEDTSLLDPSELVVDSRPEDTHLGRERHIGAYQWRYIDTEATDIAIEVAVVALEIIGGEELVYLPRVDVYGQWLYGDHELL